MRSLPSMVFSTFMSATDSRYLGWQAFGRQVHSQLGADSVRATDSSAAEGRSIDPNRSTDIRGVDQRVTNAGTSQVTPAQSGVWRLLAPNNRELARSARLYGSEVAAATHFIELQQLVHRLEIAVVHGAVHGAYAWVALLGSAMVMTAGRAYEGTAATRGAMGGALAALKTARVELGDDVRLP